MIDIIERDDGFWIVEIEMIDLCDEPFASEQEAEAELKKEVRFHVAHRPDDARHKKDAWRTVENAYFSTLEAAQDWIALNRGNRWPAHSKNWLIDCYNFAGEYLRYEIVYEEGADVSA